MKKKIIMLGIILISTTSLLLVTFYIKTKNIKYISSNEIESYSNISMKLDGEEITTTSNLNSGYYRIDAQNTNCNGTGNVSWSNISHNLKVKVTNGPLKCTIALVTVREDFNIVAMYVNGSAVTGALPAGNYYLDTSTTKCYNGAGTEVSKTVTYDNDTRDIKVSNITEPVYCEVHLNTGRKVNILVSNGLVSGGYTLTNEMINGNFENGVTEWRGSHAAAGGAPDIPNEFVTLDTSADRYTGSGGLKSLKNMGTAFGQQGILWYVGNTSNSVNLGLAVKTKSLHRYHLSCYMKTTATSHMLNHIFLNGGTNLAFTVPAKTSSNTVDNWTRYNQYGQAGIPTDGSNYMAFLWVDQPASGTMWLDDVMLIDFTIAFGEKTENTYLKSLVEQMPYFEPYGSIRTEVISSSAKTYSVYHTGGYTTANIESGNCTISGNTLTVPAGSSDSTCIIRYS